MAEIITGNPANWTDTSGSIASNSVSQAVVATNPKRAGFWFQNVSDTDMWIDFGQDATADSPSLKVVAGALYEMPLNGVDTRAVNVICATSGKKYSSREW